MSNLSGIPPSPIPLDTDVFDMFMRERSSQLDVALQGRGTSPQAAADARRMSQKTGWTVEEVAKDPRKAEAFLQRQEIESPDFAKRYPLLSSKMDDLEFVDMIRDDMGNLKMTEGAFDYISRSWQVARNTSARGTIGARAALAGRGFTAYERMQLDTFDELARAHAQRDNGFTGAAVELVGSMVDTLGSAVAVGGAASAVNPAAAPFAAGAAAFGESMRLEGGNLYADLIEKGYTPAEAAPLAGIFGAAIGAVDLVGLKVASKPFKETAQAVLPKVFARGLKQETREEAFKQALKSYGAALVGEPTTEAVQEVLQMTAHEVGRKIYPKHAFESDFDISQAGHAFTHTLKGMVVLGGLGAGGHYIADLSKAADAKHTARVFEKMKETAQDSKQRERDPDGRAEFVNEKVAGTPAQTVYVRGDKAAEVLQQMEQEQLEATGESDIREKLEQTMPGLAEQIAEADEAGGDVAIPTGDFEAKLLLTDIGQALVEHSTLNADGMTIAEARMFDSMKDAEVEHYREQAAENMARDQELAASAREVEDIAYQQLQATGVMSAKDSRTSAQFYRDFVVTQAADMNITPKEFYDRYPLRVQRGAASERASVFNQERWQQILEQVQEKRAAWMAGDKSPKAMVEVVKLQREAAALLAEPGQAVEFMPNERGQYSLAGPDVRKPGRFRVTQFDESGPVGHVEHATLEEAIRSELSSGKTPRAPRAAFNQDGQRKTDTPEFREWFGESKVVDEDGEPITVFHGGTFSEREDTPLSGMHWGTEAASAERKADWEAARRNAQRFGASEGRPLETTKAYLSMQRPLRVTDDASNDEASLLRYMIQHPVKGVDMAVARRMGSYAALQQAGYDGLVYENEVEDAGSDSYVVFRPDQIKSVNNRGTFDRNDPNILRQDEEAEGQAPRGEFVPESLTVLLGEKADASTFLHESAHYFLSVYADLATQPDAPARVVADMDKLLESFGIEDVHAWNEMTLEQQREHHEAFAYNFEQYLFEGKAPSAALIPLFQRFRAWLTRVYRNIRDSLNDIYRREFGKDLPILTGEVRDVMDRMLASEEQIGQAQHVRSMVPLFQTQEESGMSDAAWEAYQTNAGRADDDAIDAMTQKSLADMRWLSNAQSRVLKEKQQEAREIREAVRAAEKERIEKLPVYRAMTWLRRGETVGPEGDVIKEDGPHKLDNETVQRILGIEKPQKKPRRGKSLVTFIRERGGISHASWTSTFPGETTGEFKLSGVFRGKPRLTAARGTTGLEWEQMAEVARAAGYGPQADVAATENLGTEWFVEALADAANGVHLYRQQDLEAQGEAGTGERAEEPNAASEELLAGTDPRKEDLRRLGWGKNGLLQNDGVHPDRVAEAFGFTSGEALIDALLAAPRMGVAIDEATDARMLAEHSDLTDPEMIRLAVEEAVHNEARARFVTTELKALAKVTQPTRVMVAAAKEAARQILATKAIRDIRPRDYSIAEARAGRAAFRAIQDGDTAEAIRQKQNQLVQNQLATLAAEVRREVEKTNKDFRRVFKTDEKLAKTRDLNTIQAARAVLSLYDLGQASKTPLEHLKPVIAHDPEAWAELSLQVERAVDHANTLDADGRKWKALTLDEYRDLRETIDGLWHKSRRTRQVTLDGKRQDIQGVAARAAEQLEKGLPDLPKVTEADGKKEDAKNGLLSWIANARRIEAFMLTLDGGKPGVMTSLFRRVKEAGDNYRKDAIAAVDAYDELMRNHDFGPNVKIDASEELGYVFRNKSELLGALRHTGNDSNKRKLLLGRKGQKWGELHSDDTLDSSRWDAFVARMIREGKLTKADFDLVQSIWDLNEAQKPAIQKAHYANFGFHMREVEAQSFTNEFGTYRGGYVPARADAKAEPGAARQEIDSLAETQKALPITPRGFTKSRLEGYDRQLSTDLSDGGMHLAQVLRFVHMQEAVNDVKRVLRNPEVEGLLMRHNRSAFRQIIDPWLSHSALQSTGEHAKNPTEKVVGMLSRSANAGIMFANVSNSLQNFTGWFTAATRVKPRHLLSAIGSYSFGQRSQMTKDAAELSTMMANRLGRQMFEVQQQIRAQATQRGAVGKAVDWVRQNTYFLQRITQNVVDVTTWTASYNQGIAEGLNQQEAVRQADSAVRLTQMATDADDISNWEHGGPIQKAIFPFQNWFIGWANNNLTAFQGAETVGARVGVYLYGVMLPMVVAEGISQLVNGRLEDDDDDGWGDDMADLWWRSQLSGTLAAMPGVGRFGQLVVNRFLDDEVWNDRMPAPPFVSVMTKGLDALVDIKEGKGNRRDIEDLTTFFGNLTGLPLGTLARMASYQIGVASGDVEPEGPFGETFDFLRGTVTGRAGAAGR